MFALVKKWPDETTRELLAQQAVEDNYAYSRRAALQLLAEKWPDETTRDLLAQRAVEDENGDPRVAALRALAEKWPDETTRELLAQRAVEDENGDPRVAALRALAEKWPDETTRDLLAQRAVEDENGDPRGAALRALAEKWPDETTRELLAQRAFFEGAAASLFGGQHSQFGRIVLTRDLDGVGPYLDPVRPVPPEQIEKAAKRCAIPLEKVDAQVASLSEWLGWDITQGAPPDPEAQSE